MRMTDGIRERGFRRWHERTLLASHGWLAGAIVAAFAAFGSLEVVLGSEGWVDRAGFTLAAFFCGAVTLFALRRFLLALVRAQKAAAQAECSGCHTFGRLEVIDATAGSQCVRVRCRACGQAWTMDDG